MEEDVKKQLDEQSDLLIKIYISSEKTRRYFLWTLIISVVVLVLPLIGLIFVIPNFLDIYSSGLGGL